MADAEDLDRRLETLRRWDVVRPDRDGWSAVRARAARRRRRFGFGVAAAVVAVTVSVVALVPGGDDGLEVVVDDPSSTTTVLEDGPEDGRGAFEHLGPGWHQLDTGPVPPSSAAAIAWTGSELVVLSAARAFAHDPAEGTWRELPPPGIGDDGGAVAWIGDRLLAVDRSGSRSASLRPGAGEWRDHGSLPDGYAAVMPDMRGPTDPNRRPSLLWTGEAVIDATHGAVFDPVAETWTGLPLPPDPVSFTQLLYTNPVWDGQEVVLAYPHDVEGLAYDPTGASFRTLPGVDPSAVPTSRVIDSGLATRLGDVVFVLRRGMAATFDARHDRWEMLPPVPGVEANEGCPSHIASLGDSVVVAPCHAADPVHLVDGEWRTIDDLPVTPCCVGQWLGVDGALVVWDSDTDTYNNPEAPYVSARVWLPPSS